MNYNFTGSVTQRTINLGSAHEISSTQLAQQAREERALRQEIRMRHAAATKIQSAVRGRKVAKEERHNLFEQLKQVDPADFEQSTTLVSLATRRAYLFRRMARRISPVTLTGAEDDALDKDEEVLDAWALRALQSFDTSVSVLLHTLDVSRSSSFSTSLASILQTILAHIRYRKAAAQVRFQRFLDILAQVAEQTPKNSPSASGWCLWLVHHGLFSSLRTHLLHMPVSTKSQSQTLNIAVQLCLAPLKQTFAQISEHHLDRSLIIERIIENILTIPDLPNRISRFGLTKLVVDLPLLEVANKINQIQGNFRQDTNCVHVLANLLALGWKRVPHFDKGVNVRDYLLMLTALQDNVPSQLLTSSEIARGKTTGRITIEEMDVEGVAEVVNQKISASSQNLLSTATTMRIQILPSQDHISSILTASAKFPSSTREALCAFLASTLQSWDAFTRDRVLACITYRHATSTAATANGSTRTSGVASHSIEGLVRELWRGWFRGSPLARSLSTDLMQGRQALLGILNDGRMKSAWPCLLILCQLYSRSLLTIGDDEFYPNDVGFGTTNSATSSAQSSSSTRNPLSLDEVVALSAILRNLAFSLYWYEGMGGILNDLGKSNVIGMKQMDLLSLRDIVTRLLQQLHQRDSRRAFAPKDHWLMSGQLDLHSFIQSVVLEEDELSHQQAGSDNTGSADVEMLSQEEEDVADDEVPSRPAISSRIASRRRQGIGGRSGGNLTARSLAYLSPRLGLLNNIPFVIPFEVRVEIFHQFTALDYERLRQQTFSRGPYREVSIRRSNVAEDGFLQLNGLGAGLKHKFAIKFIDQFGIEESGIDGGGLFKEFLTSLVKEAFDTDRGLWRATADQQLYPNPHSYAKTEENRQWYRFLGRILGKALYHGILVDVNFASFFLSKWLGKGHSYLDDLSGLESLDKEVYRNLLWLKHYAGDIEKDLALDFTVTDEEFGEKHIHELVPNGRNIAVTRENRLEYIYRVSHYRLNEQIRLQSDAFLSGLTDMIDLRWLRMLNREELRVLISGSEGEIDLDDLQKHTVLGGYHEKDEVVEFFWASLRSFSHPQRKAFLKFVTSCPSPPLLGFAQLNPNFGIRHGGEDTSRLPSSSTCVNLLKLPRYTSYEQCRSKLLYAIESGAGFDLS